MYLFLKIKIYKVGIIGRKGSRGEGSVDGHASLNSQTELSLIQHYISSLSANQSEYYNLEIVLYYKHKCGNDSVVVYKMTIGCVFTVRLLS